MYIIVQFRQNLRNCYIYHMVHQALQTVFIHGLSRRYDGSHHHDYCLLIGVNLIGNVTDKTHC